MMKLEKLRRYKKDEDGHVVIRTLLYYIEVKTRRVNITITRNTAVPFGGQTTQISSNLSLKRACGSRGVNFYMEVNNRRVKITIARNTVEYYSSNRFHLKVELTNNFPLASSVLSPPLGCWKSTLIIPHTGHSGLVRTMTIAVREGGKPGGNKGEGKEGGREAGSKEIMGGKPLPLLCR